MCLSQLARNRNKNIELTIPSTDKAPGRPVSVQPAQLLPTNSEPLHYRRSLDSRHTFDILFTQAYTGAFYVVHSADNLTYNFMYLVIRRRKLR